MDRRSGDRQVNVASSVLLRRAIVDLVVIAAIICGIYFFVVDLDLFERLHDFSRSHENWELDEFFVVVVLTVVGGFVFGIRRMLDQQYEIKICEEAERDASRLALIDPLTGLANRRHFERRLNQGLADITGSGGGLALMSIDLDRFKPINDVFGHAVGDEVLVAFARRASEQLEENGLLARVAGDEFGIVLHPVKHDEEPRRLAEQLLATFDDPLETDDGTRITIGISIGIAVAPRDGTEPQTLVRRADVALYRVKADGRRNYRFFAAEIETVERRRAKIELDLRDAIAAGSIEPRFQPIVDLPSRTIVGFEALARWNHPTFGEISPREFVSIAEDCGLISQLSTHLLRRACQVAQTWPKAVKLAFNLSRVQFADPMLVLRTARILGETGLSPNRLEFEVSEAALATDVLASKEIFRTLRQSGIRIALDNFGKGNSSISHLRQFSVDRIKIDRSFIADMSESDDGVAFVRAIVGIGSALKIPVTAEGIERGDIIPALAELGCSEGQGFVFGEAIPADETLNFLDATQTRGEAI